jgi:hypothetical protein
MIKDMKTQALFKNSYFTVIKENPQEKNNFDRIPPPNTTK